MDEAARLGLDALLIVGDLFESNKVKPHDLELAVRRFRELAPLPIVLLPGNHDCLNEESIYRQFDFEAACPNLRVIKREGGELVTLPELGLAVWGRPIQAHAEDAELFNGAPPRNGLPWHVLMAHGYFQEERKESHNGLPIWPDEIASAECDYIALGHLHRYQEVSQNGTKAFYSGSPMGSGLNLKIGKILRVRLDPQEGTSVEVIQLDPECKVGPAYPH